MGASTWTISRALWYASYTSEPGDSKWWFAALLSGGAVQYGGRACENSGYFRSSVLCVRLIRALLR